MAIENASDWVPDVELLRRFDDSEWLRVERNFCGRLFAYTGRRVSDPQAREDIVQETFLGAVRGIDSYNSLYTFEQFLFGICRNRTIDHLRRRKAQVLGKNDGSDSDPGFENLVRTDETPSRIVGGEDLTSHGRRLLIEVLREWVQETWQQGEFTRMAVIEALFSGGWRNRDTWEPFGLRDETAVAGIKFRALKRLRELAARRDPDGAVFGELVQGDEGLLGDLDVAHAWKLGHVSCPGRYWLGRSVAGSLPPEPTEFVRFHLEDMKCDLCVANRDDLSRLHENQELSLFLESVGASTVELLRSKNIPPAS